MILGLSYIATLTFWGLIQTLLGARKMTSNEAKLEVPKDILENWQEIVNILAGMIGIPVALIMRFTGPSH